MTLEETIAHHRWCADNCEGEVRDEHLQMVAWLEELVELRVWNSEFGCSMHDYNRGALQAPCLRLDYGFGEEWASVELGDGTGYVRLADYERLRAENAKLREYAESYAKAVECEGCGWCPYDMDAVCDTETMSMRDGCKLYDELRELGVKAR